MAKKTVALMARLNRVGAGLAGARPVRAATDVTGFGLLGHLASMCRASGVAAEIDARAVPVINRQNLETARPLLRHGKGMAGEELAVLTDAQTSGGLLLCVPPNRLDAVLAMLKEHRTPCAAVIGRIVRAREVFPHLGG